MSSSDDPFHEPEAHENHERYLITYADMITLLMALFIILFAIGQTDLEKYAKFAEGAHAAVGGSSSLLDGGGAVVDSAVAGAARTGTTDEGASPTGEGTAPAEDTSDTVRSGTVVDESERLASQLATLLDGSHTGAAVAADARGVVVTLPSDDITFAPGSWSLLPAGLDTVHEIAAVLQTIEYDVVVNGHTDDRPMSGPLTNWELSTNRASSVVREIVAAGVPSGRLSAAGYADTRPVGDNATAAGRAANRRVEIVVLVPASANEHASGLHIGPSPVDLLSPTAPTPTKETAKPSGH